MPRLGREGGRGNALVRTESYGLVASKRYTASNLSPPGADALKTLAETEVRLKD